MESKEKKMQSTAEKIISLARSSITVSMRFMSPAVSALSALPFDDTKSIETDGKCLRYSPLFVIETYKREKNESVRVYLHILLHSIMRHMFINSLVNRKKWDLACDMAVEGMMLEFNIDAIRTEREEDEKRELIKIGRNTKILTAERIYRYLIENPFEDREFTYLCDLFKSDDHRLWYQDVEIISEDGDDDGNKNGNYGWQQKNIDGKNSDSKNGMNGSSGRSGKSDKGGGKKPSDEGGSDPSEGKSENAKGSIQKGSESEKQWKKISESIEEDIESFSKNAGSISGNLAEALGEINRQKYDYDAFLRKFAVLGEAIKINDDEFDYIFYTYGMKLFGNMPLIEPLEYKEVKKIKTFVIAIDTSGSTKGTLVKKFLERTYSILSSTESFFTKVEIHIIQCDSKVQKDETISSLKDLDRYLNSFKIYGGGGTDFRPVFRHVDDLIKNGSLKNLKGLIYFTDGIGIYPEKKPGYDSAFVFLNDEYKGPPVPPWAIKLVLGPNEI